MDDDEPPLRAQAPLPVAPGAGHLAAFVPLLLILVVIGVAVLKPWDLLSGPPAPVASGVPHDRTPVPGETGPAPAPADAYDALWITCGSPSGWRAATLQQWLRRSGTIRSWIAIEPVEASGPADERIPFAPVATDIVTAIGYCAPLAEDLRPPATAGVTLWALRPNGVIRLTPVILEPPRPDALGGLWRPASEVATRIDGIAAWPPGRYAIQVVSPSGSFDRWLGIEIVDLHPPATDPPATDPPASDPPATASPAPSG